LFHCKGNGIASRLWFESVEVFAMTSQLIHPGPEEAMLCLRAMRSVIARADGVPPASRAIMEAAKHAVLNIEADIDTLPAITPAELAAGLHTPGLAEQFVQAMLINVLADGMPDPECMARVEAFAAALGVAPPALHTARLLCEQHMILLLIKPPKTSKNPRKP
jgi:hypothetical protein